jgi:serine protease
MWVHNDYQYTAATGAMLTLPTLNSTFTGSSALFTWSPAANAGGYYLWIGSTPGGNDIYNSAEKTGTSYTFNGLPTNGEAIYVRLYTAYSGTWTYNDYQFTAAH